MSVQCPGPSLGLPTLRLGFRRREEEQAIPNYRFLFHPLDTITGGDITNTIVDHNHKITMIIDMTVTLNGNMTFKHNFEYPVFFHQQ